MLKISRAYDENEEKTGQSGSHQEIVTWTMGWMEGPLLKSMWRYAHYINKQEWCPHLIPNLAHVKMKILRLFFVRFQFPRYIWSIHIQLSKFSLNFRFKKWHILPTDYIFKTHASQSLSILAINFRYYSI